MVKKNIPYGHQYIDQKDINEVVKVLKSDWLTQGPRVEEFEKAVAKYCGAKYAVAVSSGTAALYVAYKAVGIKEGDEIITTPLTFAGTANMFVFCGAKPVFVDVEKDTLNINPDLIGKAITSKTKAIVPIDFAGQPCNYDKILKIAKKRKLMVIEDAAHALGSKYKNRKVGSFTDMTILSFHPVKTITTGEGGMVLTDSKDLYEKSKLARNHGMAKRPEKGGWYYEIKEPSFNFRITDMQCALGVSQLKKIDKFIQQRIKIVSLYNDAFKNFDGIKTPTEKDYAKSAWHIYTIQVKSSVRKKIFDDLRKQGIGVQVHYIPLHFQPFYKNKYGFKKGDFPVAEEYYNGAITLPLFPDMSFEDVKMVIKSVKNTIISYQK